MGENENARLSQKIEELTKKIEEMNSKDATGDVALVMKLLVMKLL